MFAKISLDINTIQFELLYLCVWHPTKIAKQCMLLNATIWKKKDKNVTITNEEESEWTQSFSQPWQEECEVFKTGNLKSHHSIDFMTNCAFFINLFHLQWVHLKNVNPIAKRKKWWEEMDSNGEGKGVRECVFHQSQPCKAIWAPISKA